MNDKNKETKIDMKEKLSPEEIVRRARHLNPFIVDGKADDMSYRFVSKDPNKLAEAEMKGWEVVSTADPKNKDLDHVSFKGRFGKKDGGDTTIQTAHSVLCARDKRITEAFQKDQEERIQRKDKGIEEAQERMAKAVKDKDDRKVRDAYHEMQSLINS
jgi:hypothetical protein